MAVFKNFEDDELIISCKCGCDEGIHFSIVKDGDYYAFVSFINGNFYKEQKHSIIDKMRKIWSVLANKDYYYADVRMGKEDFKEFKKWINRH